MKFTTIFNETISLWPEVINICDGKLIGEGGGFFPELSTLHEKIEEESNNISELHGLMAWSIFGDLHAQAINDIKDGIKSICISKIDLVNVEKVFSESLFADNSDLPENMQWSEECKGTYINDSKL